MKARRRTSSGSALVQDKENIGTPQPSSGDNKRRRLASSNVSPGTSASTHTALPNTPIKATMNIDSLMTYSEKINEIDDLTAEGVVPRAPLGDMGNMP